MSIHIYSKDPAAPRLRSIIHQTPTFKIRLPSKQQTEHIPSGQHINQQFQHPRKPTHTPHKNTVQDHNQHVRPSLPEIRCPPRTPPLPLHLRQPEPHQQDRPSRRALPLPPLPARHPARRRTTPLILRPLPPVLPLALPQQVADLRARS